MVEVIALPPYYLYYVHLAMRFGGSILVRVVEFRSAVHLRVRTSTTASSAIAEIRALIPPSNPVSISFLELDLSSLASVRTAAVKVHSEASRLDILMLNAGIMASAPGLTQDGYEVQFGVNYLGHALKFKLLLPLLEKTSGMPDADVRAIMVTSMGHQVAGKLGIDFANLKTTCEHIGPFERYGSSKLANVLWARQSAKEYSNITFAAAHPGLVGGTGLGGSATGTTCTQRVLMKISPIAAVSLENGAKNQLWTSVAPDVESASALA
ncbi:NAD(P)-binding protein [Bimuria novae-zelandiae CBS 107.79]|uniref:NAD(P)-binding protein n=1 Tax=Bimuria novae-zelandiae CBS 107.79 TaxID=1447943 RepID=A0A6A5US96_9PLEO|nr:NAD(P)-binding protein [Bimuria novae-zelandiae CBS 107.79]